MMNNYYKAIPSEQMSDYQSFYELMAERLPDDCKIIEIGISEGRSIIMMASIMRHIGKRCRIWGVDNMDYGGESQRGIVINHIIRSGEDVITLVEKNSLDASCDFPDDYFDLVFLDSSHTNQQTKAEIRLWIHKVKVAGTLAGHDYQYSGGVKDAVNELISPESLVIHDTSFHLGVWAVEKTEDFKLLK